MRKTSMACRSNDEVLHQFPLQTHTIDKLGLDQNYKTFTLIVIYVLGGDAQKLHLGLGVKGLGFGN